MKKRLINDKEEEIKIKENLYCKSCGHKSLISNDDLSKLNITEDKEIHCENCGNLIAKILATKNKKIKLSTKELINSLELDEFQDYEQNDKNIINKIDL
jgi:uncharacterized Zn finger protein